MTFTSDETVAINNDEVNMFPSDIEGEGERKRRDLRKARSVSFAPTVREYEIPSRYDPSYVSPCQSPDYLDALVESYKLQTLTTLYPFHYQEEKRYVPKTTHTRLTPNWREHRVRHLMNRLEELSLWDREEELKISQAQFLREQKLEQIQDRQRNHNLCLHLMRQRHGSEMESANSSANDEGTAQTTSPYTLRRRLRREQEKTPIYRTPGSRFHRSGSSISNRSASPPGHASTPDYERLVRAHSNGHVRVPFKEVVVADDNKENDDRKSNSLIHSRQPISTRIHQRTLNDDLNAITQSPLKTNKSTLRNLTNSSNILSTKYRSSSVPRDNDMNVNLNLYSTSRIRPQSRMVPLLSAR